MNNSFDGKRESFFFSFCFSLSSGAVIHIYCAFIWVRHFEWTTLYSWKLERLRGHFVPCVGKSHNRFKLSTITERKACIFRGLNVSISSKKSTILRSFKTIHVSHAYIFLMSFLFCGCTSICFWVPPLSALFYLVCFFWFLFQNILNNSEPVFSSFFSILLHVMLRECKGSI